MVWLNVLGPLTFWISMVGLFVTISFITVMMLSFTEFIMIGF